MTPSQTFLNDFDKSHQTQIWITPFGGCFCKVHPPFSGQSILVFWTTAAIIWKIKISNFWISGQSVIKENCHNSRTNDNIDMKLGPITKLDKRNKTTSKNLMMTSCRKIVTSWSFFGFLANLEKSKGRIPDTESAKVMLSWIVPFCLTKTENKTKKSLTHLSHYCFE